jgi:hypothetical protein
MNWNLLKDEWRVRFVIPIFRSDKKWYEFWK